MKLICIGGYGHSGSTLLEYLMTGCADCIACGEVSAANQAEGSRKCTCQRVAAQCPVRSFVADSSFDAAHWSHEALDAMLVDQVSANGACAVDSSKTAWSGAAMAFKLQRRYGDDLRLVHIVRNSLAVCWSLLKKDKRLGAGSNEAALSIATTLGWLYEPRLRAFPLKTSQSLHARSLRGCSSQSAFDYVNDATGNPAIFALES